MVAGILAALSWEPQVKGALYVLLAVVILVGSAYLLLSTNLGGRLGFQITAAGLFGFLTTIGIVWWVYGIGPSGTPPSWQVVETIVGSTSASREEALVGFPDDWRRLEFSDPAVADAQPVVDGVLVDDEDLYDSANDYLAVGAFQRGGETYGPLGLDFRPFDLFHKPNYLVVQVQHVLEQEPVPGAVAAPPEPDPNAPLASVVLLRDLGTLRLNPAVFTISSALIFGLLVYQLHVRDKVAAARRELEAAERERDKTGAGV